MNFNYYSPTKIIFGAKQEENIGKIIKEYGYKKVLLHYGSGSIKRTGLYDVIIKSLNDEHINFIELGGVKANPDINLVRKGVKICKDEHVDFILAVGGGSVIDSAKSMASAATGDIDPLEFTLHTRSVTKALPVGVILSIAAAGSELSNSCVISDNEHKIKNGFNTDLVRPVFAVEDPILTYTVSPFQTACGVTDIMMHTLERFLTDVEQNPLADAFAIALVKEVIKAGKIVMAEPNNYDARATLMLASSFSHNGLTGMGGKMYFTVHKLEHQLSGKFDSVAHAAGLSVLFPNWAKYTYKHLRPRFLRLAYEIWEIDERLPEDVAIEKCINNFKNYFNFLNMPLTLEDLNINYTDADIYAIANDLTKNDSITVPGFVNLNRQDVINIFNMCKKN